MVSEDEERLANLFTKSLEPQFELLKQSYEQLKNELSYIRGEIGGLRQQNRIYDTLAVRVQHLEDTTQDIKSSIDKWTIKIGSLLLLAVVFFLKYFFDKMAP